MVSNIFQESMKVEMGIMEAKFENAQRVLEADLQSTMEKQVIYTILMRLASQGGQDSGVKLQ